MWVHGSCFIPHCCDPSQGLKDISALLTWTRKRVKGQKSPQSPKEGRKVIDEYRYLEEAGKLEGTLHIVKRKRDLGRVPPLECS